MAHFLQERERERERPSSTNFLSGGSAGRRAFRLDKVDVPLVIGSLYTPACSGRSQGFLNGVGSVRAGAINVAPTIRENEANKEYPGYILVGTNRCLSLQNSRDFFILD